MVYQPLDLDQTQQNIIVRNPLKIKKVDGKPYLDIHLNTKIYGAEPFYITLRELANSDKNELFRQHPISKPAVCKILFGSPNSLVLGKHLISDVEIAVINPDGGYIDLKTIKPIIWAGRHRISSLLTMAKYSNLPEALYLDSLVRVTLKEFANKEDLLRSIISSNANRRVLKPELIHVQASIVCANTVNSVTNNFERAQLNFAEALSENLNIHQERNSVFKSDDGNLLTSAAFIKIAAKFVSLLKLKKPQKTVDNLRIVTTHCIEHIPEVLKCVDLLTRENVSSTKYAHRIAVELHDKFTKADQF
jgi:hypothetical protein